MWTEVVTLDDDCAVIAKPTQLPLKLYGRVKLLQVVAIVADRNVVIRADVH